jgi:hypothetical protein
MKRNRVASLRVTFHSINYSKSNGHGYGLGSSQDLFSMIWKLIDLRVLVNIQHEVLKDG